MDYVSSFFCVVLFCVWVVALGWSPVQGVVSNIQK
jgi:hypothetical protein